MRQSAVTTARLSRAVEAPSDVGVFIDVTDSGGVPVAGARVFSASTRVPIGRTDEEGVHVVSGACLQKIADGDGGIVVHHRDYLPTSDRVSTVSSRVKVVLSRGLRLRGRVVSFSGTGCADVAVSATIGQLGTNAEDDAVTDSGFATSIGPGTRWSYSKTVRTDGLGYFEFNGLVDDSHALRIREFGYVMNKPSGCVIAEPNGKLYEIPARRLFVTGYRLVTSTGMPQSAFFPARMDMPQEFGSPHFLETDIVKEVRANLARKFPEATFVVVTERLEGIPDDHAVIVDTRLENAWGDPWVGVVRFFPANEFSADAMTLIKLDGDWPERATVAVRSNFPVQLRPAKARLGAAPIDPFSSNGSLYQFEVPAGSYRVDYSLVKAFVARVKKEKTVDLSPGDNGVVTLVEDERSSQTQLVFKIKDETGDPTDQYIIVISDADSGKHVVTALGKYFGSSYSAILPYGRYDAQLLGRDGKEAASKEILARRERKEIVISF